VYDEQGRPHTFDIYLYGSRVDELTQVAADLASNRETAQPFVGMMCSTCGSGFSVFGPVGTSLDPAKVSIALKAGRKIQGVFDFYRVRCPKGSFHAIANAACTKCGRLNEWQDLSARVRAEGLGAVPAAARAWANRWTRGFESYGRRGPGESVGRPAPAKAGDRGRGLEPPDALETSAVIAAAALAGVPPARFESLGTEVEGRDAAAAAAWGHLVRLATNLTIVRNARSAAQSQIPPELWTALVGPSGQVPASEAVLKLPAFMVQGAHAEIERRPRDQRRLAAVIALAQLALDADASGKIGAAVARVTLAAIFAAVRLARADVHAAAEIEVGERAGEVAHDGDVADLAEPASDTTFDYEAVDYDGHNDDGE